MHTRARARTGTILLLVAALTLLTALPALALEPTGFEGVTPERVIGGGTCDRESFGRTGAYGNCPGDPEDSTWLW